MRRAASAAVMLCAVALGAACYSYRPVQSPSPGMDVRARLTADAAVRRSQGLDDPVVRLEGMVVESTASLLTLDVLIARTSSAFQDVVIRDTVRLEMGEIQSLQARRFSPARTTLFVAGIGVAAFGVVRGIDQIVGGTDDPPDDGTPTSPPPLVSWRSFRMLLALLR